jgi:hypothetical protein
MGQRMGLRRRRRRSPTSLIVFFSWIHPSRLLLLFRNEKSDVVCFFRPGSYIQSPVPAPLP